jgi:hypothetical protein
MGQALGGDRGPGIRIGDPQPRAISRVALGFRFPRRQVLRSIRRYAPTPTRFWLNQTFLMVSPWAPLMLPPFIVLALRGYSRLLSDPQ